MKNLKSLLNLNNLFKNTFFFGLLVIFLTVYGPRLSPKLPSSLEKLFDNPAFRSVVIFLIIYLANKDFQLSDQIRARLLEEFGVQIQDSPQGVTWKKVS